MKFVTLRIDGMETPVLFPEHLSHLKIAQAIAKAFEAEQVSAGFVEFQNLGPAIGMRVEASGHSESLSLHSRPEDAGIIQRAIDMLKPAPQMSLT